MKKAFLFIVIAIGTVWLLGSFSDVLASTQVKLEDPLGGSVTIQIIIGRVIKTVMGIMGSIALFMFFDGAWNWLLSFGNAEKVKKGMMTMVWAGLGILAIFASYVILQAFLTIAIGVNPTSSSGNQTATTCEEKGSGYSCRAKSLCDTSQEAHSNLCPGGADNTCCKLKAGLQESTPGCTAQGDGFDCRAKSLCKTDTIVTNKCDGGSDNVCCVAKP